jgi:ribose transport system permease protein
MNVRSITADPTAAEPTEPAPPPDGGRATKLGAFAEAYALLALTIALIFLFSLLPASSETFPTSANVRVLLGDQAIAILVALAVLVPVVTRVFDFTPGATAGLAAIFAASVVSSSGSVVLAVGVAVLTGAVIGLINGLLVSFGKINSVIATLGMTILIQSVVEWKTHGNSIVEGIPPSVTDFGATNFLGIPKVFAVAIVAAVVVHYLLRHTAFGRELYAVGANQSAARLVGLRVDRLTLVTFVVGGVLAGIGGALLLARSGAGNPTIGPGFTLPAYAAVFLGVTSIRPGRWNVGGVLVAIAFLGVLNSGLNLAGAQGYLTSLANGLALLIGVGLANLFARRRGRPLVTS